MKSLQLVLACLLVAAVAMRAGAQPLDVPHEDPALDRILDRVEEQLLPLFRKYYPQVVATNLHRNGLTFEHAVTTFKFPLPESSKAKKHENPIKRGPKPGGILGGVSAYKGPYGGQLAIVSSDGSNLGPMVIDRKIYKTLCMAPYSASQDAHLWVVLDYPPDASPEFVKEFVAIITAFEKGGAAKGSQRPPDKPGDVLEGTLRVHPKFHYRYYLDGFGDGQECALLNADDRLSQIKPGSLVRVRGELKSKFFGDRKASPTTALLSTWVIYMNVDEVEVLRN